MTDINEINDILDSIQDYPIQLEFNFNEPTDQKPEKTNKNPAAKSFYKAEYVEKDWFEL